MRLIAVAGIAVIGLSLTASPLSAQKVVPVKFAKGSTGALATGSVKGDGDVTYTLALRGGQQMHVNLKTANRFVYFNLMTPSGDALVSETTSYDGPLPETGTYKIMVYLVRAEARRGGAANFSVGIDVR